MRKKIIGYSLFVTLFSLALFGCQPTQASQESQELRGKDILFQYSVLSSLLVGVYDGEMTYAEIKQYGDFGLGTFNALDGEMIEINHQVYQIKADGIAYQVDDDMKTPFAVVTYFEADQTVILNETMSLVELKEYLDTLLPTENIPYAVKINGKFSYIKTRSVPRQTKPYPPLLDVIKEQPIFEFNEIEGVLVGFRLPSYMEGANAPGYHFHFITKDRDAGGHVLECELQDVNIEIDYTDEWHTVLPEDDQFYNANLTGNE